MRCAGLTTLPRPPTRPVYPRLPRPVSPTQTGGATAEKRAYKFAKLRLGSHRRAQKKREEIKGINARARARA